MALGRAIVRQLDLDDRGAVLDRWLAHHAAELIAEAEGEVGEAKVAAEARAVDVVLKLWANRRALPAQADPLGGFREAIAILERLEPDENPWARLGRPGIQEGRLRELFDAMSRAVVGGILLTASARGYQPSTEEERALEPDERRLLSALNRWLAVVAAPRPPKIEVRIVDSGLADTVEQSNDAATGGNSPPEDEATPADAAVRSAILENLERLHADLGRLLDHWRRSGPGEEITGGGDT